MGWQCSVYELDGTTVLKIKNTAFSQFWKILFTAGPLPLLQGEMKRVHRDYERSLCIAQDILALQGFDKGIFGNPVINLSDYSYTQDKVIPLKKAIAVTSIAQQKEYYRQYIELMKYLWSFGMHEGVFNFALNAGIDKDGRMILIDLGELTTDKQLALNDIVSKRWLRASSYWFIADKELKKYYRELMEAELTPEVLESEWNKHRV